MSRRIEVIPHNTDWAQKYAEEAALLRTIFGDRLLTIHHIGSTTIPGILAKPVIDIIIVVSEIETVEACNLAMIAAGYVPRGEAGIPNRRFFRKETEGIRSHHVHIYPQGNENIATHLNFRDYLRAHPDEARAYSQLKERLAEQFRYDSESYTESKTDFVERINRLAADWRKDHPIPIESD